jgi:predicted kinase
MKSLSLSRPLVIMVIGLPGSGKSFFAGQFADMFGAPLVSADFIRHAIFPESNYTPDEDALVNALSLSSITELLKTRKTIVVDGGVNNRSARVAIERLATAQDYGKLTIWVQTDEPTSLARSQKRSAKRQADALNAPMDLKAFERYRKQFSVPSPTENVVVVSGKHTYATQARVVLKKLVSPRDTIVVNRDTTDRQSSDIKPGQHTDVQPRRRNVTIN